jgi:hypothetical protein
MTMAIMGFIVGGLGLLCGACSIFDPIMVASNKGGGGGNETVNVLEAISKEAPHWLEVQFARSTLFIILSLLVLVASVGLLNMKGWARVLSIIYGLAACALHIPWAIYQAVYVMPAMQKLMAKGAMPGAGPANAGAATGAGYFVLGLILVVFVGHALALLGVMFMPTVSQAFAGQNERRDRDEDDDYRDDRDDYDDEFDDDYR